jgi:CheY-like chemotaxis protein
MRWHQPYPDSSKFAKRTKISLLSELMRTAPTILVVEDDDDTRNLAAQYIGSAGYSCALAESAVSALDYLEYNVPSLVLLDYHMPTMDGVELLKWIRAEARLKKVPVILVTGDSNLDLARIHALGANGYFLKGWSDWDEVMKEIERYVT